MRVDGRMATDFRAAGMTGNALTPVEGLDVSTVHGGRRFPEVLPIVYRPPRLFRLYAYSKAFANIIQFNRIRIWWTACMIFGVSCKSINSTVESMYSLIQSRCFCRHGKNDRSNKESVVMMIMAATGGDDGHHGRRHRRHRRHPHRRRIFIDRRKQHRLGTSYWNSGVR